MDQQEQPDVIDTDKRAELCFYAMMLLPEFASSQLDADSRWDWAKKIAKNGPLSPIEHSILAEATALRLEGNENLKARMRGDFG